MLTLNPLVPIRKFQHVVLGVGGARDFWDPSEQDFHTPLEMPEPKTRAAKQKVLEQESGPQLSGDPLLTLVSSNQPEVYTLRLTCGVLRLFHCLIQWFQLPN